MKIQLKRSNVLDGGVAKAPTAEQMSFGELAVNYAAADPTIFLKNSAGEIIQIAGATFRQTSGQEEGSSDKIVAVSAGTTYPASITGNPSGFTVKDNGNKLCLFDADGNDCNAELKIINIDNNDPVTTTSLQNVQVQIPATTIATSLDLQTGGGGNLIWHTRMATGYEEYTQ